VNCVPLSVIMELGTPNRWMISVKNSTACSALIYTIMDQSKLCLVYPGLRPQLRQPNHYVPKILYPEFKHH